MAWLDLKWCHFASLLLRSMMFKAGKRVAFGKEIKVKAKPARTVVKAFAVAALKKSVK